MKKKTTLKIILIIILTILLIICTTMITQAVDSNMVEPEQEVEMLTGNLVGTIIDGIVGILLLPLKIGIVILGTVIRAVSGGIALIGGADGLGNTLDTIMLSPEDILFNKIKLTDVNVFDLSTSGAMLTIRQSIATWYYALRNLAVVILLIILVYVGLRMALTTVAEDAAKYKKMLMDWLVSFVLVFLLHYIIIFTVWASNGLVEVFAQSLSKVSNYGNAINDVLLLALDVRFTVGMGAACVYVLLCVLTIIFLIMYIRRMLTVSFLILIAPIVTITYSIDKMGDGKSQALNAWLKEFVYNVLIQPFHCLIYLIFGTTAVHLMNGSLSSSVLAIIMIMFILEAEGIIKQIFGFQANSLKNGLASAVAVGAGVKVISSKLGSGAKAAGAVKGAVGGKGGGSKKPDKINKKSSKSSSSGSGGSSPYGKGDKSKAGKVAGILGNKAKNLGKGALKKLSPSAQFRMAARMTGAAFGAATGDVTTAMGMGAIGGAVGKRATDAVETMSINKRVSKNEQYFADAYQTYQQQTGMDVDDMKAKTEEILNTAIEDVADRDKAYAHFVHAMRDTYADIGETDTRKKLIDTIDKINNGEVQPRSSN